MQSLECHRSRATGQAYPIRDLRDGADTSEVLLVTGHQQNALFIADVDRQRKSHPGKDDCVVHRDEEKATIGSGLGHVMSSLSVVAYSR
jgi:hypothetical protein